MPTAETPARFVVGIDLGTTNSAVACADTQDAALAVAVFEVPQLVAAGVVERRETLPSFHYQPAADEFSAGALGLPWDKRQGFAVGVFARDQGVKAPGRLVASAKSWLSHGGVDRTAELLPWHAADDVEKLSPVAASARYLGHIRAAWNHAHPAEPLELQDVVLTLPASFDEVARELTVRAARAAGLPRVVLIEEPQAAFYAWINKRRDDWQRRVSAGQTILVCDVGGGTSDFTLIRARPGEAGKVAFHRVAVGEHLILGGDNLDLAVAKRLEADLTGGGKLEPRAWESLVRQSRVVKETLLADDAPGSLTVNLAAAGSKLIGGGLRATADRDELRRLLLDGFLPDAPLESKPLSRQSGFQEFGLPYAADPGITRHLAAFLTAHREILADEAGAGTHDPARPDVVLFNGGFFASSLLRERLLATLAGWFDDAKPVVLDNDRLDLAVARGAAYYGLVRRGHGVRIAAGLARTYYVGVETDCHPSAAGPAAHQPAPVAVCLIAAGTEPGQTVELAEPAFSLRISEPVELPILVSSVRLTDKPGATLPIDREQLTSLPPIRTVLKSRGASGGHQASERDDVPVRLHAGLSEIGTLELSCHEIDGPRSWRLQFDVRSTTQTDKAAHESAAESEGVLDDAVWAEIATVLDSVFGAGGSEKPGGLMKRLTAAAGGPRDEWPTSLLRRMWERLRDLEPGRRRSPLHEARWLNLTGFCLRPGYGYALDDWRVGETWKLLRNRLAHADPQCVTEWRVFWRRLAGGLEAGQQQTLADPVLSELRATRPGSSRGSSAGLGEVFRLLASLERLSAGRRIEFGRTAAEWLKSGKATNLNVVLAWSLGRVGSRIPLYGPLNNVVPPEEAKPWADLLLASDLPAAEIAFPLSQLARKTGDRFRDLSDGQRGRITKWLEGHAAAHLATLVREGGRLDAEEQGRAFGESLPKGLRIG